MRFSPLPLIVLVTLVSGCVQPARAPQIVPAPRPTVAPPVATPEPTESADAVAPGVWTYESDTRGSRALFGLANAEALFVIRCDRTGRRIFVSVPGSDPGTITLRATSALKGFPARPTGAASAYLAVEIVPTDGILDALAFSRGHFTVEIGARQTVLPAWPEFSRVVEDCRG